MNTWSHFLVNAIAKRPIQSQQEKNAPNTKLPPIHGKAFLLGSIMPDVPLILMSIGVIIYDLIVGNFTLQQFFNRSRGANSDGPPEEIFNATIGTLFSDWFFNDPWVITGHHLFGAPLLLLAYMGIGYFLWKKRKKWGAFIFWIALGCMIHTLFDIPLHTDDGPLLFFPLNWDIRFISPVSYWDRDHHGEAWSIFENRANIVMIAWLIGSWIWRKVRPQKTA